MTKANSRSVKKSSNNKPAKGQLFTPPNASKELPKSFYQQTKTKGTKKSEVPDL